MVLVVFKKHQCILLSNAILWITNIFDFFTDGFQLDGFILSSIKPKKDWQFLRLYIFLPTHCTEIKNNEPIPINNEFSTTDFTNNCDELVLSLIEFCVKIMYNKMC